MSETAPGTKTPGGTFSDFRGALIGGIVGAVATALVGGGVALVTNLGSTVAEFSIRQAAESIFNRLKVERREGKTTNNFDYEAFCLENEKIVGGQCIITSGDGYLQNEGTGSNNNYFCTYSRRGDPAGVKGKIWAACLGLKDK